MSATPTFTVVVSTMADNSDKVIPPLVHQATTSTLQLPGTSQQNNPGDSTLPEGESNTHDREKVDLRTRPRPSGYDLLLLLGAFIMLLWPWLFFGIVWAKKGIQMNNDLAPVVANNPHATTYIITFICTLISTIVGTIFSLAIIRLAQEWVTHYQPTVPFHVTALLALRHQSFPWKDFKKDGKGLLTKKKWWPAALVILCVLTFPHLVSTTTSLLTPIPFNQMASLTGYELDFLSTDPDCLDWFAGHPIPTTCDWVLNDGKWYSYCLGDNQLVDLLEAARGNILELTPGGSEVLTFSQLGGLHFVRPTRGVLPIGPNGIRTLNNTLDYSPLTDPDIWPGIIAYNYTFDHQGLAANVSCSYETTTPIDFDVSANYTLQYDASCDALGQTEIMPGTDSFSVPWNDLTSTLMYWACESPANNTAEPTYSIYLFGYLNGYTNNTGNITCTVSPMLPALYPVTFQSSTDVFSVGDVLPANETGTYLPWSSYIANYTFLGLGNAIYDGQNYDSNVLAELVVTFGVQSFGLEPYVRNDTYLQLYEQLIQGILEYETSYMRWLYSAGGSGLPPSCIRAVNGSVNYQVLGWFVTRANIGFLIPMTLINGAALIVILQAVILARSNGYLDPLQPRDVHYDPNSGEEVPTEWKENVAFQPTSVLKENYSAYVEPNIEDGAKQILEATVVRAESKIH